MVIQIYGVPPIIEDNSTRYLMLLEAVVNAVDELSSMQATRKLSAIAFRIAPSTNQYFKPILKAIKDIHYTMGVRVEFSKSMKTSRTVDFSIDFAEK